MVIPPLPTRGKTTFRCIDKGCIVSRTQLWSLLSLGSRLKAWSKTCWTAEKDFAGKTEGLRKVVLFRKECILHGCPTYSESCLRIARLKNKTAFFFFIFKLTFWTMELRFLCFTVMFFLRHHSKPLGDCWLQELGCSERTRSRRMGSSGAVWLHPVTTTSTEGRWQSAVLSCFTWINHFNKQLFSFVYVRGSPTS